MKKVFAIGFVFTFFLSLSAELLSAQTKTPLPTKPDSPEASRAAESEAKPSSSGKRNERPGKESSDTLVKSTTGDHYVYEFTRPGFIYEKIVIRHGEDGKGTISFLKDGFEETLTDPVHLSAVTMTKIDNVLNELKFLDSDDEYQHERDFSHLGNITYKLNRSGKERTVKFNWTDNKSAKMLMDEYRRISNEYTWRFEIMVARENQPLLTPGMMDGIDAYIRRNEVSDPVNLVPFLTELSNDERLPLMARNRAAKLIKQINKAKK